MLLGTIYIPRQLQFNRLRNGVHTVLIAFQLTNTTQLKKDLSVYEGGGTTARKVHMGGMYYWYPPFLRPRLAEIKERKKTTLHLLCICIPT